MMRLVRLVLVITAFLPLWGVATPLSGADLDWLSPPQEMEIKWEDPLISSFKLIPHPEGTQIFWEAPVIEGADYYFIERRTNNGDFELIGGVDANNIGEVASYQLADRLRTSQQVEYFEYRIEIWFKDGHSHTTEPLRVHPFEANKLTIIPVSPSSTSVRLQLQDDLQADSPISLEIFNLQGNVVQKMQLESSQLNGNAILPINSAQSGIYFFKVTHGDVAWFGKTRF